MSLKIEVDVPFEAVQSGAAADYLNSAMSAIGFARADAPRSAAVEASAPASTSAASVSSAASADATTASATRERGKPSPGSTRRTKAEIAEDEAADKDESTTGRQISTAPEERTDPANPDAATAEQDAADEAAETEAAKAENVKKFTHDDVRNALGKYVKAYGMAAAQADGPVLIGKVLGDPAKTKVSDLPDDQAVLARAVAGVEEMLTKNPFNRTADL